MVVEAKLTPNKLERLTAECASDEMKLPCRINQRWYCINENGRWRKHKCKTMPPVNYGSNKSFKKCACFTRDGLIYTRIPVSRNKNGPEKILRTFFL